MDQLIELYFELGFKYADIVSLLNDKHGYEISESKLKQMLRMRRLTERKHYRFLQDAGRGKQNYCKGTQMYFKKLPTKKKTHSHHDP